MSEVLAAEQLWDEFGRLHAAAGEPTLDRLVALAAQQSPPRSVSDSSISEWLNRQRVPGPRNAPVFLALVDVMQARAQKHSGYQPRSTGWWQLLLRRAQEERASAQKTGRPRRPTDPAPAAGGFPGWPLDGVADPFALEVKRPIELDELVPGLPALPAFVPRPHDRDLARRARAAAGGQSTLAVLVGGSSTGKTRSCWEALELLRGQGDAWRLWHPIDPSPTQAVLRGLPGISPRTVVWLNDAHLYLQGERGEEVAAGLRELLRDPARAPMLVLVTLWPGGWAELTARPVAGNDPHAQARELLVGHDITVPGAFSAADLQYLSQAGDPRLELAAAGAEDGQVAQFLAGVPELTARYRNAPPTARALIHVAMDARRLGMQKPLPHAFLESAAPGYLSDDEWNELDDDWLEQALAYATTPCRGVRGPLTRFRPRTPAAVGTRCYQLTDYLDQQGRRTRRGFPPPEFWAAACHADPGDLTALGDGARNLGLLRQAARAYKYAASRGDTTAATNLIRLYQQVHPGDPAPLLWAAEHAPVGDPWQVTQLLRDLGRAGAVRHARILAARAADGTAVGSLADLEWLMRELQKIKADEQLAVLAARAAEQTPVSEPDRVASMLRTLHGAGAAGPVQVLAARAAGQVLVSQPGAVAKLLSAFAATGAEMQAAELIERDPAAHAELDHTLGVKWLLGALREAGAEDQVSLLAGRAAALTPVDDPDRIFGLRAVLLEADAPKEAAVLTARAAADIALDSPGTVALLLDLLQRAGDREQVAALLKRNPGVHVPLDDPRGLGLLLASLRKAGARERTAGGRDTAAREQAAALLMRDPAAQVPTDSMSAVTLFMRELLAEGASGQAGTLAARAARDAPLGSCHEITMLVQELRRAGADEHMTTLLARDPASHVPLRDPREVAALLGAFAAAGWRRQVAAAARGQAAALAARASGEAPVESPHAFELLAIGLRAVQAQELIPALAARAIQQMSRDNRDNLGWLQGELEKAGMHQQATFLAARADEHTRRHDTAGIPAARPYGRSLTSGPSSDQDRFGSEPDGSPSRPWSWEDLDGPATEAS